MGLEVHPIVESPLGWVSCISFYGLILDYVDEDIKFQVGEIMMRQLSFTLDIRGYLDWYIGLDGVNYHAKENFELVVVWL